MPSMELTRMPPHPEMRQRRTKSVPSGRSNGERQCWDGRPRSSTVRIDTSYPRILGYPKTVGKIGIIGAISSRPTIMARSVHGPPR